MMKRKILAYALCLVVSFSAGAVAIAHNNKKNDTDYYKAYELYVAYAQENGESVATYEDWLATIKGDKGDTGEKGDKGDKGDKGQDGANGKSAYEIWKELGNTGSETDFIACLKGEDGEKGNDGKGVQNVEITMIEEDGVQYMQFTFYYTVGEPQIIKVPMQNSTPSQPQESFSDKKETLKSEMAKKWEELSDKVDDENLQKEIYDNYVSYLTRVQDCTNEEELQKISEEFDQYVKEIQDDIQSSTDPEQGGDDEPTDPEQGGNDEPTDPEQDGDDEPTDPDQGGDDEPTDPEQGGDDEPTDPDQGGEGESTDPEQDGEEGTPLTEEQRNATFDMLKAQWNEVNLDELTQEQCEGYELEARALLSKIQSVVTVEELAKIEEEFYALLQEIEDARG